MESPSATNLFELQIDPIASGYIKDSAKWGKFLSILGFIFCGLFLVVIVIFGAVFSTIAGGASSPLLNVYAGVFGPGIIAFYLAVDILYFFPCLFLYRYSSRAQGALRANDQELLNGAFKGLRACLRFLGIVSIIFLGLFVLMIFLSIINGATRSGI